MRLIFIFFLLVNFSYASEVVKTNFKCGYHQTRVLKELNVELKSKGYVIVKGENDIVWMQTEPLLNRIELSKEGTFQIVDNKKIELKNPIMEKMVQFMSDFLKGNFNLLNEMFVISEKDEAKLLIPKDEKMAKVIESFEIEFKSYIHKFYMSEKSGNGIKILFHNCLKINEKK